MRLHCRLTPTARLSALALLTAVACSDGSPTGPTDDPSPSGTTGATGAPVTSGGGNTTSSTPTAPPPAPSSTGVSFLVGAGWGEVGTRLIFNPTVRVIDVRGLPVAGATVTFAITSGGGALTGAEQVTDSRGIAMVGGWTLGTVPGPQTLTASTAGYAPATLTVTAVAGQPAGIVVVEGDGQTATVVTNVAVAPAVRVVDRFGNGLPRIEVEFASGEENGGVILRRFERTDGSGVARVGFWTLGRLPGTYVMHVRALTLSAQLSATAVAGAPARLQVNAGNGQTAPAGSTLPVAAAVQVTDTWGNPLAVAGIRVTFAVPVGSGSVSGAEQLTDANGVARVGSWTLGTFSEPSVYTLRAETLGLTGASFFATGT